MHRLARRRTWWAEIAACLLLAAAATWLFRHHLLDRATLLGNHDRLHYFLAANLAELNADQTFGHASTWNDATFMGYDMADLPVANTSFSPMRWVMRFVSRGGFLYWAGLGTLAAMLAAGWAAYVALRALALRPWTAVVGAIVYLCCVHSQIRFAQSDTGGLVLALLPLGVALLVRADALPDWTVLAGMFLILGGTLELSAGLLAAYVIGFLAALTLVQAAARRQWRLVVCGGVAGIAALLAVLPRVWSVGRELALFSRGRPGDGGFEALYGFFNVRSWEILRWLDDGIFGRFPSDAAAMGNNINLSEGFQLYSSTFATLLVLGGLVFFRGKWLGVFRSGTAAQRFFAATLLVIPFAVCTKTGAHFLYGLFLGASLLHARIVILAALPAAWLAGAVLDHLWSTSAPGGGSIHRPRLPDLAALTAAGLLLAAIAWIAARPAAGARLSVSAGPANVVATAWRQVWSRENALEPPSALEAVRIEPTTVALAWRLKGIQPEKFEIAMQRDGGAWSVIGNTENTTYTVGDTDPHAIYVFAVRGLAGGRRSPPATAQATSAVKPRPAAPAPPIWLRADSVVKITVCALILSVILLAGRLLPPRAAGVRLTAVLAAGLVAGQALLDADFRLNGPQTLTRPHPFADDNFFNASPPLRLPTLSQVAAVRTRLESDAYRTVFLVNPSDFFGFPVPYVAEAWRLRVVEGYLSGVPARLAALPWPDGVRGFRTISFTAPAQLPWALLGRLNVKYAVPLTPSLYFAGEAGQGSSLPEVHPLQNPEPVTPRVFFTARTLPAAPFAGNTRSPMSPPERPEQATAVEGIVQDRSWPTDGAINARFEGDEVTILVAPASHERFLVLNEMYHPGWRATAGGRTLPVYAANTVMRGVVVPAGVSEVQFHFHPWADVRWSWLCRLAGCGLLALALIRGWRARPVGPVAA